MGSKTRTVAALFALLAVSFALHYALFGSLPIGAPQMLDSNLDETDADAAVSSA